MTITKNQIREAIELLQDVLKVNYGTGEPDREGCYIQINVGHSEIIGYDSEVMVTGATPAIIADFLLPDPFPFRQIPASAGPEIRDMQARGLDS
ncbi:MAG: hypothetical protein JW388_0966 [Nitrospira sp.]|nr:hypothetical protein [Nitrospira sp.]